MNPESKWRMGIPILDDGGKLIPVKRYSLRQTDRYKEDWIQRLVDEHPSVLPLADLEPAFEDAVPVCRELPLPAGNLDNLLMTPRGDLVLVECKLWRNSEARRKVLAQVMDYAKDMQSLSYEGLEAAVRRARKEPSSKLYDLAGGTISESDFIDRTSRNLRSSRALLLVVGDGITEELEALTQYLQQHAGMHFTLGLIQLTPYELPDGRLMVVPCIPLRTTFIERVIVSVKDGTVVGLVPEEDGSQLPPKTLTEEQFFLGLDASRPGTSVRLQNLIARGADMELEISVRKSLSIRLPTQQGTVLPLVVGPDGTADTSYLNWDFGRLGDLIPAYHQELARRIPGAVFRQSPKGGNLRMTDRALTVWDILDHGQEWLEATRTLRTAIDRQAENQ